MEALEQDLLKQIIHIILNRKKVRKIILFGSRARGIFKKTSDIDLAIMDPDWTDSDINLTKHALEEGLKTPLKIDLVNFHTLSKSRLKDIIREEGQVIYEQ